LIVDDAHRWADSRVRFEVPLQEALKRASASGRTLHVTLIAPEPSSTRLDDESLLPTLFLKPLPFRAAQPLLPGKGPWDRLKAYSVFGGLPGVLSLLDRRANLASNLSRLVWGRAGALRDAPLLLLERHFQRTTRYAAILTALAPGEGDWSKVKAGVKDLTASGQAGPYLKRLEEIGLVEVRRSLDAPRRSRTQRYRITDPFTAFWFRTVFPLRGRLPLPGEEGVQPPGLTPQLSRHMNSLLPEICRSYMTFDAMEEFGANARECGSLWGPGYDLPVAGVLGTGAAFYGQVVPPGSDVAPRALAELDTQIRETRYGFGRERRLRVVFAMDPTNQGLSRAVARRDDTVLVSLENLAGED
jgi:hypothetical protein